MNRWLFVGAVSGFLAVAAGAFAAHGLQTLGLDERAISFFRTGADYHLIHSLAIVAASSVAQDGRAPRAWIAAWFFTVGIVLFSGSLYLLALTGSTAGVLVFATPAGGLCLLSGWGALAFAAIR